MPDTKPTSPPSGSSARTLGEFTGGVRAFTQGLIKTLVDAAGSHEDAPLVESAGEVFVDQFTKVLDALDAAYAGADIAAKGRVDEFMQLHSGMALIRSAEKTLEKTLRGKLGAGLLRWISFIIHELKKIIDFIFTHISENKFIKDLILLIDEIINDLLAFLGGIFGLSRMAIAEELSQAEVHFMNEMTTLNRWKQSVNVGAKTDQD